LLAHARASPTRACSRNARPCSRPLSPARAGASSPARACSRTARAVPAPAQPARTGPAAALALLLNFQPSTFNLQPPASLLQPSTLNPQTRKPSILNPQPSTLSPQPSTFNLPPAMAHCLLSIVHGPNGPDKEFNSGFHVPSHWPGLAPWPDASTLNLQTWTFSPQPSALSPQPPALSPQPWTSHRPSAQRGPEICIPRHIPDCGSRANGGAEIDRADPGVRGMVEVAALRFCPVLMKMAKSIVCKCLDVM
jgi:hypothetical protein